MKELVLCHSVGPQLPPAPGSASLPVQGCPRATLSSSTLCDISN